MVVSRAARLSTLGALLARIRDDRDSKPGKALLICNDAFAVQSRLLALLCLASEPDGQHDTRLAEALTHLGWRQRDGRPVSNDQARWAIREATHALANVASEQRDRGLPRIDRRAVKPMAVLLARTAFSS